MSGPAKLLTCVLSRAPLAGPSQGELPRWTVESMMDFPYHLVELVPDESDNSVVYGAVSVHRVGETPAGAVYMLNLTSRQCAD